MNIVKYYQLLKLKKNHYNRVYILSPFVRDMREIVEKMRKYLKYHKNIFTKIPYAKTVKNFGFGKDI